MSACHLIAEARRQGVTLTLHGAGLRCTAPQGRLPPELRASLTAEKPAIIRALLAEQHARALALAEAESLPLEIVHRQTEADLAACAELTEQELAAYLRACHALHLMAQGRLPAGYSARVECAGCGAVWLPKGHPPRLLACPWCLHRLAGVRIPRPPVRCADCQHARPDSLNPQAGHMTCTAGERGTWPQHLHTRNSFQPRPRNPNDPTQ